MADFDIRYCEFRDYWVRKVSVSCLQHLILNNYKLNGGTKVPFGIKLVNCPFIIFLLECKNCAQPQAKIAM